MILDDTIKAQLFPSVMIALNSSNYSEISAGFLMLHAILASTNLNAIILLYKETLIPLIHSCSKLLIQINNNFSSLAQKIVEVQSKTNSTTSVFSNIQELNSEILMILYKYSNI